MDFLKNALHCRLLEMGSRGQVKVSERVCPFIHNCSTGTMYQNKNGRKPNIFVAMSGMTVVPYELRLLGTSTSARRVLSTLVKAHAYCTKAHAYNRVELQHEQTTVFTQEEMVRV